MSPAVTLQKQKMPHQIPQILILTVQIPMIPQAAQTAVILTVRRHPIDHGRIIVIQTCSGGRSRH